MYVVSGCPRSGTSLMMDLMRVAYGKDRLLGKKFPQEEQIEQMKKQGDNESDAQYQTRMYVMSQRRDDEAVKKNLEHAKDMNPNGFWEMLYTVQGCHYRFNDLDRLDDLLKEETKSFCKIVSQGLAKSDPQYIDKVIFMIRHPRAVAKSQEKLSRPGPLGELSNATIDGEPIKIHTPEMFINVTGMVSNWFIRNPNVQVHYVIYDELLEDPSTVLNGVRKFIGEDGDFGNAIKRINKKLRRSQPEDVKNNLWADAEFVYDHFVARKYQEIADYLERPDIQININNTNYMCLRNGLRVTPAICKVCRAKKSTYIENQKKSERVHPRNWEKQPCVFECGYNIEFKPLSIEESIKNNFWKDGVDPINIPIEESLVSKEVDTEKGKGEIVSKNIKKLVLGKEEIDQILENKEIFQYEFPEVSDKDWETFTKKRNCGACRKRVVGPMRKQPDKMNVIFSKLLGEEVEICYPGPIDTPIIEEFDNIVDMQKFLKSLKEQGKQIQNATPSPNGKGGYLLVVM